MGEILKDRHKYRNQEWRGGDVAERKYMCTTRSAYMCTCDYMYNLGRVHKWCILTCLLVLKDEYFWHDTMIFSDVLGI